jgi:hypothetical protein
MRKYKRTVLVYEVFEIHTQYRRYISDHMYTTLKSINFLEVRLIEELLINRLIWNDYLFL